MGQRIRIRRDTTANWTAANPILSNGEPAYNTTTKQLKIGDGVTAWNSLPYFDDGLNGEGGGLTVFSVAWPMNTATLLQVGWSHLFGVVPTSIELFLKCTTAANGYLPNDIVKPASHPLFTIWANANQIGLARASTTSTMTVGPKTGGVAVNTAIANWSALVVAFK